MGESGRTRIGDFEIVAKIGEGSLGIVFKAVCLADGPAPLRKGLEVALKRLHPAADLMREMQALGALDHPHIVRCLGCFTARQGEWDEAPFLVTELLDGVDLAVRLESVPAGLPWEEAFRILDQALDALAFAGSRGVIHRDIKPSNLFLCRDGTVKVIDFGLARRTGGTVSLAADGKSRGGLTGTLDYMAPEFARIEGFRGDAESDMFSFGVLACQVLTGQLPFPPLGEHPEIGFIRRWTGPQPPRAMVSRPVAYAWEGAAAFLARALNGDRGGRYASFREARAALAAVRPRVLKGEQDEYRLEAFLASGGFCDVFRARAVKAGAPVAVKRLHAGRHEWRFRREANLLRDLRELAHPALVRVHELIEEDGAQAGPSLVMEYLPGEDLRARLEAVSETGTGLPWAEAVALFIRYLEGLEALHGRGIAHRDLKPANLYAPAGRPREAKLLDLGIACEKDGTVSMQGMPPGTLDYMAPELASETGSRGTPQSDLFALGCSLVEALAGRPAFRRLPREDAAAIRALLARSESERAFADAFAGFDAPVFREHPELVAIAERALRFDPARRYGGGEAWSAAGAAGMRRDLEALLEPAPAPESVLLATSDATVTAIGLDRPRRRRWPWAAGLAAAAAVAAGIWAANRADPSAVVPKIDTKPAVAAEPARVPEPPAPGVAADPGAPAPAPVEPAPVAEAVPVPAPVEEAPRVVIRPKPVEPPSAIEPAPVEPPAPAEAPAPAVVEQDPAVDLPAVLAEAEASIGEWRAWLGRLSDPLASVTLKRFEAGRKPPVWKGELPFLLEGEREALPPDVRWRVERARLWEQAAAGLKGEAEFTALAAALAGLADRAKAEDPAVAEACRMDGRLLGWDGKAPAGEGAPATADAALWRAHATAAAGDDQDAREVLGLVASAAAKEAARLRVEDGLLALRAADACLERAVAEVRDKTSAEFVMPRTGRTVRDPVAAYAQAVARVRAQAAEDAEQLAAVAMAMAPEAASALAARLQAAADTAKVGDWALSLAKLDETPWRAAREAWAPRLQRLPADDRAILDHVLGLAPLPAAPEAIPVVRLRK